MSTRTSRSRTTSVAVSPDGNKAYICNEGDGTVSIVDVSTNTVFPETIAVGDTPDAVAFTPDGTIAYVCNYGDSSISVIDPSTNAVTGTIHGVDHPTSLIFTLDSSKAVVTNGINDTLSCILTASGIVVATPGVGSSPASICLFPDGTKAYVGNVGNGTVSVYDVYSDGVEAEVISVSPMPYGIAMTIVEPPSPPIPPPPPTPPPPPICPPTKFLGEIIRTKDSHSKKAILSMTWNASSTLGVDLYQIFHHRKKIASIPASSPRMFRTRIYSKHLLSKRISREWLERLEDDYRVRAVASGDASALTRLKVTSIVEVDVLSSSGSGSCSCSGS